MVTNTSINIMQGAKTGGLTGKSGNVSYFRARGTKSGYMRQPRMKVGQSRR